MQPAQQSGHAAGHRGYTAGRDDLQANGGDGVTLRWRLTLFYTALLAALLTAVALTTLFMMRSSLIAGVDRDLRDTYSRFTKVLPDLGLNGETAGNVDRAGDLVSARYQFPNSAIQVEQLPVYNQVMLADSLARAKTPQDTDGLFQTLKVLRLSSRVTLGVDRKAPIELSQAELEKLIRSPGGLMIMSREVKETFKSAATPMRLLVSLAPLQFQAAPLGLSGGDETLGIVYLGRSLEDVQDTLRQLQRVILGLFLTGLATAGTGAYLLAGQALRPLRQVQRAAERIGGQTLAQRVPEPATGDEVAALARALNGMLGRLENSFEAQRRFTSDASHELRTPVTAISGHAGYLLRRTSPTEGQRESLNIIQRESERLTNLITSLLQLARSDSGALTMQKAPILSTLFLSEITRELLPLAQAQQTTLAVSGQDVAFEGDPDRLKQVIINLTSNALKAGAKTITLQSQMVLDGQQVRLSVKDDGPGIPPDQLERLFDRFYRLEDSRSRDQGGAGLGLSIARGIVDAHGGRIWLESTVGVGTTAHVQLPVGNVPTLSDDDVP